MHHLVGLAEIALAVGVSRQRIDQLIQQYPDFPEPEARLASGRIWSRTAVDSWLSAHPDRRPGRKAAPMLDRFDAPARSVLLHCQEEARALGHNYIGTEHMLLSLVANAGERGSPMAAVMDTLDITPKRVRAAVAEFLAQTPGSDPPGATIPFTPRAKRVMELSALAAFELRHDTVGPEHMLIGLVYEGDGIGARVLADAGVDLESARQTVRTLRS